jgi:hypothetical protein
VIDPDNEYPRNYSGHIRVETVDGRQIALDQPHMRGGVREPLTAGRDPRQGDCQLPPGRLGRGRAPCV